VPIVERLSATPIPNKNVAVAIYNQINKFIIVFCIAVFVSNLSNRRPQCHGIHRHYGMTQRAVLQMIENESRNQHNNVYF
jgi:hypothetical protein